MCCIARLRVSPISHFLYMPKHDIYLSKCDTARLASLAKRMSRQVEKQHSRNGYAVASNAIFNSRQQQHLHQHLSPAEVDSQPRPQGAEGQGLLSAEDVTSDYLPSAEGKQVGGTGQADDDSITSRRARPPDGQPDKPRYTVRLYGYKRLRSL